MKQINKTNHRRTVLSVSPQGLVLNIGTDLKDEKTERFLGILDDLLTDVPSQKEPYYGHFSFSRDKLEVTLSNRKYRPKATDLTYRFDM